MMVHTIKFCPCNLQGSLEWVRNEVRKFPDVELIDERCVNYCGQCLEKPFALYNGKNIVGNDGQELLDRLVEKLSAAH
ncbi:DUF1450 domain-containing protein [Brevibacillus gelatini]|uniref:DUF1450 domain-containing protein n=1 Tax=Brevibacillus gelatini TaxID=1655277 RepID=UPI003D816848